MANIHKERKQRTKHDLLQDIKKHRKYITEFEKDMHAPGAVEQLSTQVFLTDQIKIDVEIFRPTNSKFELFPTIFHIPGSGFNTLNPYFAYITCSQLAMHSGCQVIVINHLLAPEDPFPKGQESALKVFNTLMQTALKEPENPNSSLKIDVNNIALSGYSSGGTFAAWLANQEKYTSYIKQLFLISPMVDFSGKMPRPDIGRENCDTMPQSALESMKEYYLYNVDHKDLTDGKLSPFFQTIKKNHPPTHFLYGEIDRLASDSTMYAEKLSSSTIVTSKKIENTGHIAFWFKKEAILDIAHAARQTFGLFELMRFISADDDSKSAKINKNFLPKEILSLICTYLTILPSTPSKLTTENSSGDTPPDPKNSIGQFK